MLLAIVALGLILTWLDIFGTAAWPAGFRISFLTLGLVSLLALKRPEWTWLLALTAAAAADWLFPIGFWGVRFIGYGLVCALARIGSNRFWPFNRRAAALILVFSLSLAFQVGGAWYHYFYDWWIGQAPPVLFGGRYWLDYVLASLATVAAMAAGRYLVTRFNILTRRVFLIRH